MNKDQLERLTLAFEEIGRALRRLVRELQRLIEWFIPAFAAEGIAELEVDLKLRSEVGLRTDLLALFDP